MIYSIENGFEAGPGVIGVYDASDGSAWLGEFPAFGIDPHKMLLMRDGRTLAVAYGGIETHPDYSRAKVNLDRMQPSRVFIDRETGGSSKHALPPRTASTVDPAPRRLRRRNRDFRRAV